MNDQGKATVSNEGATMLELLHVIHLMAKSSVDIAKFQYAEAGDGTTSVTLQLSGETPHGGRFAPTDRWSSELSALPPSWQLTRPRDCCDSEGGRQSGAEKAAGEVYSDCSELPAHLLAESLR